MPRVGKSSSAETRATTRPYRPAFDQSTLYYASKVIAWLNGEVPRLPLREVLAQIARLDELSQKHEPYAWACLNSVMLDGNPGDWVRSDNFTAELLFGLLCLNDLVEAICLGEAITWMPHPTHAMAPILQHARHVVEADREARLLRRLPSSAALQQRLTAWLAELPSVAEPLLFGAAALEVMATPFIDLAGHLYDTSHGTGDVMAIESHECFDCATLSNLDLDHHPGHRGYLNSPLALTSRMLGYVLNGIAYQKMALEAELDYVANAVRRPLIAAIWQWRPNWALDRLRLALRHAVGVDEHDGEAHGPRLSDSAPARSPFFLTLILATATLPAEILPAAYAWRERLAPIRLRLAERPWDQEFDQELGAVVADYATKLAVEVKLPIPILSALVPSVKIECNTQALQTLYKIPVSLLASARRIQALRTVGHQYRAAWRLWERLDFLVRNAGG